MDDAEGVGGGVGGGDQVEQFHRNEAISAVTDEGFGEEDDDYEDLYNDVNVGEGFLQSLRKNEDLGFRNEEETRVEPLPHSQHPQQPFVSESAPLSVPGVGRGEGEKKFEGDVGRVEGFQNQGFRGSEMGMKGPVQPNGGMGSGPGVGVSGAGRGYGGGGLRVELGSHSSKVGDVEEQVVTSVPPQGISQPQQLHGAGIGSVGNEGMVRQGGGVVNGSAGNVSGVGSSAVQVTPMGAGMGGAGGGGAGGTILFVGDLHWWTTDAELEAELVKYGAVKEVKFFDEKASGKSKGYCQVEFYDPAAASACKEGMNGHVFNGRPCVVAFASPYSVKRMGEAQVNRTQQGTQQNLSQTRRGPSDAAPSKPTGNNIATGGNYQGGDQNRNFMRGSWGRGNPQGMGGRGPVGPIRNRPGGMSGRGIMGNGGPGGNGFGQNMGPGPPLMHPQGMMGQGFDPAFGGPMGRMGSYGGFPGAPQPPFQGLMSNFPPVGNVGLPGVAPHVNPAFFGRGMPMNGMGMMPNAGVDGPNMGMWSDPNMGGWTGEEHAGRAGESSFGEEAVSDHQFGEPSHDRSNWQNPVKEKERAPDREFSGSSDRRYREDREPGFDREIPREKEASHDHDWQERRHRDERETRERDHDRGRSRDRDRERSRDRDRERSRDRDRERERDRDRDRDRDRYREDRDRYADHHRYRDREADYDDEWERRPSRTHSKSRVSQEEERPRSRDADYGKRRRITSE